MVKTDKPQKKRTPEKVKAGKLSRAKKFAENLESIIIAVIFVLVVRQFAAETFNIPTPSMEPALLGRPGFRGDRIIADKLYYRWHDVRRWDIAVFKSPVAEPCGYKNRYIQHTTFIKRMIGLPGEKIEIRHGDIYITNDSLKGEIPHKPAEIRSALWLETERTASNKRTLLTRWKYEGLGIPPLSDADDEVLVSAGGEAAKFRYAHTILEKNNSFGAEKIYKFIANPVGDVMLEMRVRPEKDGGSLTLEIVEEGNIYTLTIPLGGGRAVLCAKLDQEIRPGLESKAWDGSPVEADISLETGEEVIIRFSNADDRIAVQVDGDALLEQYVPVRPAYIDDDDLDGRTAAAKNSISFSLRNASAALGEIRIYRDYYYLDVLYRPIGRDRRDEQVDWIFIERSTGKLIPVRQVDAGRFVDSDNNEIKTDSKKYIFLGKDSETRLATGEPFHIGPDEYFALGDNSPNSKDGRAWGCLKRKHLVGRAVFKFWPVPPFGPFRPGLLR